MTIYTVEMHGKSTNYIGIQESESETHAAVRVVADIMEGGYELGHDIYPGVISKHQSIEKAVRFYKRKYQDSHALVDPYEDLSENV